MYVGRARLAWGFMHADFAHEGEPRATTHQLGWSAGIPFANALRICTARQVVKLCIAQCETEMIQAHSCAMQAVAVSAPVTAVAGSIS